MGTSQNVGFLEVSCNIALKASHNFDYHSVSLSVPTLGRRILQITFRAILFQYKLISCDVLCFSCAEYDRPLLPAHPQYHSGSQTEAYSQGTLPVFSTSCQISVCISLKLYILVCNIPQVVVYCTTWISQDVLYCNPMLMSQIYLELAQGVHSKANVRPGVNQIHQCTN